MAAEELPCIANIDAIHTTGFRAESADRRRDID